MGRSTGDQSAGHTPSGSGSAAEIARTLAETAARRRAVVLAGHAGEDHDVAVAVAGLDDAAPEVRASALLALRRLDRLTRLVIDSAAADPDPKVRRTAAEVAATWRDSDHAADPIDLLALLRDPVPDVAEMAAWACGESVTGPGEDHDVVVADATVSSVVDALVDLATTHDDALVREAAVASLGAIGDDRGLGAILQATTDKATVRRRAVIALVAFDGDDVDAALERALTDRDWQVRQAAEDLRD